MGTGTLVQMQLLLFGKSPLGASRKLNEANPRDDCYPFSIITISLGKFTAE
jgi:hypothetical protein